MDTPEFRVQLTTLIRPSTPAVVLGDVAQYSDLMFEDPLNDAQTAELTISMWDPLAEHLLPLQFALRIYYGGVCIFWSACTYEEDYTAGTMRLKSNAALRLQYQYLRYGDEALNDPEDAEQGVVGMDYQGIEMLIRAANNTVNQDAREVPVTGIAPSPFSSGGSSLKLGVERGQSVFEVIKEIGAQIGGPDFKFVADDERPGFYGELRATMPWGVDLSEDFAFRLGIPGEVDNITALTHTPGQPITHAHSIDSEVKYRESAAHKQASYEQGVFVNWDATDYKVVGGNTDILKQRARSIVKAYAYPIKTITLELSPDSGQTHFYYFDYWSGDTVAVKARKGLREIDSVFRITKMRLERPGERGPNITRLEVVPRIPEDPIDPDG